MQKKLNNLKIWNVTCFLWQMMTMMSTRALFQRLPFSLKKSIFIIRTTRTSVKIISKRARQMTSHVAFCDVIWNFVNSLCYELSNSSTLSRCFYYFRLRKVTLWSQSWNNYAHLGGWRTFLFLSLIFLTSNNQKMYCFHSIISQSCLSSYFSNGFLFISNFGHYQFS